MISLTLGDMPTLYTLYNGKVGLSRLFAVTTVLTLLLLTLTFGSWWAVGRSAGAEGAANSLLANSDVRNGVAAKLIEQVTSGADPEVLSVVDQKRDLLIQAVSEALAAEDVSAETKKMINQIYSFYTGETSSATLDINSLIQPILDSMAKIDPTFTSTDIEGEQVEPIQLDDSGSAPNFAPIKSGIAIALFILLMLLAISIFGLAKYSSSKNGFVGVIGWEFVAIGVVLLALYYGVNAGVKSATTSVSDPLVNAAAPIVAQTFLGMFRIQGIILLVIGIIGVSIWARAKRAQPAQ